VLAGQRHPKKHQPKGSHGRSAAAGNTSIPDASLQAAKGSAAFVAQAFGSWDSAEDTLLSEELITFGSGRFLHPGDGSPKNPSESLAPRELQRQPGHP